MEHNKLKDSTDKIAQIFLDTLKRELPNQKIMITYSICKDDETATWGGWKATDQLTLKDAAWMQCYNIACLMTAEEEDDWNK